MSSKLAAVTMVRNECDIIELFIKINSRVFDAIYILDHMSNDGTPHIISTMKNAGFPIKYSQYNSREFNQGEVITSLVNQVANLDLYDYIVPLDADEFLLLDSKSSIENQISKFILKNEYARIKWQTFCPISDDYFSINSPLYELFRMRDKEPKQYYKLIIGNEYAKNCEISLGNHRTINRQFNVEPQILAITLAHAPLRSSNQMLNKAILGSHALRLTPKRLPSQGYHWDFMANFIREKNFQIGYDDLAINSLRYAMPKNSLEETPLLMFDGPRIGLSTDSIEFKELSKINNLKSFDYFMLSMQVK